jgi:hypothetical protein
MTMRRTLEILAGLKHHSRDANEVPGSRTRFADGGQYRIETPSSEGPSAIEAVVASAREHSASIRRISRGSGGMLQTDEEIGRTVATNDHGCTGA